MHHACQVNIRAEMCPLLTRYGFCGVDQDAHATCMSAFEDSSRLYVFLLWQGAAGKTSPIIVVHDHEAGVRLE